MQLEEEKIKEEEEEEEEEEGEEEEEEEVESVCSNQSSEMAQFELQLFKKLFHDQSKGIFQTQDKDIYSEEMWIEILAEYNRRAQQSNKRLLQNWVDVIRAGKELQRVFCAQRSQAEKGVQGERDPILMEIFDPCDRCKKKVIVFPASLLPEQLQNQDSSMTSQEREEVTKVFVQYSKGEIENLAGLSFWKKRIWEEFSKMYNEATPNFENRSWQEMIQAGRTLQKKFGKLRAQRGALDVNLNQIFEFCETCKGRIPSFPTPLTGSSSSLGSRTSSSLGGEVDRYVRPRIAPPDARPVAPPVAPADHEQIKAATDILTNLGKKKLIDANTLWKLIGLCGRGNIGLIMFLNIPATLEEKEKAELLKVYTFDPPVDPPVAPADHEQIKAAIGVLNDLVKKKFIDSNTLWKLIGHCSRGNLGLIMFLKSPATLEEKAELLKAYPFEG